MADDADVAEQAASEETVSEDTKESTETPVEQEVSEGEGAEDKAQPDEAEGKATESEPEPLKIEPVEGLQEEAVEAFRENMDKWLGKNKDASPSEVLSEAARYAAEMTEATAAEQVKAWETQKEKWVKECRADEEFGGDKYDESMGGIMRAVEDLGGDEFRDLLVESGLDTHPVAFKALATLSQRMAEQVPDPSDPTQRAASERASLNARYPSSKKD